MAKRKPRAQPPAVHITLYRDDRTIRVPKRIAHRAKAGGWSEKPPTKSKQTTKKETE